uniref:Suppressor of Mek1-like n=1 Tax=Tanacetum cinerariifolium TaxID=118510 RepID=A0A699IDD2_TANCI|nr:suppressor of Mek1-like [Tanacetum cinerariifolium]
MRVANRKEVVVFVEYWLTSVDHQFLSPVKCNVEIEEIKEIYDDSSMDKNANVHEEQQTISVNDYLIDDRYELDIDENMNLEDYTVYVHENGRSNVRKDFIVDEEHVVDEVEVNMEGFSFSVQEQGADQTVTPNVDLTDEALEVLDFDSFDSDVGDDTELQEHMQKQFQMGVSKTKAFRAKAKAEVQLRGDQEQQYALLWDYCDALEKANPNTTVKIDVYRAYNPHENVRRFKRIYVCLGDLKDGFRAFGRQLLGLDGDFMKGHYPGVQYKVLLWKCAASAKKTPTRQSQRQKSAKKTSTTK